MRAERRRVGPISGIALLALLAGCQKPPTFAEHIEPILREKCQACHRDAEMAPMPLVTYEEVRPFAETIRASITLGNMPPFYASGPAGYYKDDIRLTDAEKQLFFAWADAGAPRGKAESAAPAPEWESKEWPFGQPDLVLYFPPHSPPRTLRDQWVTLFANERLSEDVYARAIHVKARSKKVVHHATLFLADPSTEVPPAGKAFDQLHPELADSALSDGLLTWFPGLVIDPLPEGQAMRIRGGRPIALRAHFGPTSEPRTEQMSVGIYFADGNVDRFSKSLAIRFGDEIRIPPGESDFTLTGRRTFREDAELTHFRVHMHLRGKSSRIVLHYPDGSTRTVFDLPRYRFYWQRYYYLAEPLRVPQGTVAEFVGVWDNSAANPLNPDPSVWCREGKRSEDEMFSASIYYMPDRRLETPLQVVNGRAVTPPSPEQDEQTLSADVESDAPIGRSAAAREGGLDTM